MRTATLTIVLPLLFACGPTEAERELDETVARYNVIGLERQIDSLMADAPTEDSMRAIMRSPLVDSLAVWNQRHSEALKALGR